VPNEPPIVHLGGSQEKKGLENKSSASDEVKSDAGKNPKEATAEQSRAEQGSRSNDRDQDRSRN
jgi:hypothetical protein